MEKMTSLSKQLFDGTLVTILAEDEGCQIIQAKNETGEGLMSSFTVFPGIRLMYNDFHMDSCESRFQAEVAMFNVNHCREGRLEQEVTGGAYLYLGAGDFTFDTGNTGNSHVEFPLRHYHGICLSFVLEEAVQSLSRLVYEFPVDLYALKRKYLNGKPIFIMHNESGLERIFSELYTVPGHIRLAYFRVKVLELLLYLDALELPTRGDERPYFYKSHVEKAKALHHFMVSRLDKHYTLEELSRRFDFPMTAMKKCFKNVYGDSIFSYMRTYRIHQSARLLRERKDMSVMDIASYSGYDSPGKFSTAFKEIMGLPPLAYRKKSVGLDKK